MAAFDHTVAIAPDQPMYQMWAGIAHYEAAIEQARQDQARKQNIPADRVVVDTGAVNFDAAEDRLAIAAAMVDEMWRAHYYLGKIARDHQRWHAAAEQFNSAIKANPREPNAYVALAKLYIRWQLPELALAVTAAGTANVADPQAADIWF